MKFEIYEYVLPAWATTAVAYGDVTGITDEEEEALKNFLEREAKEGGHWSLVSEESAFRHSNDLDNVAGDTEEWEYLVPIPLPTS